MRNLMLSACLLKRYLGESAKPLWPNAWNIVLATLKSGSTFHPCFLWKYRFIHSTPVTNIWYSLDRIIDFPSVNFCLFDILFRNKIAKLEYNSSFLFKQQQFPDNFRIKKILLLLSKKVETRFRKRAPPQNYFPSSIICLDYIETIRRRVRMWTTRDAISRTRNVVPGANGNPIMLEGRKSIKTIMQ